MKFSEKSKLIPQLDQSTSFRLHGAKIFIYKYIFFLSFFSTALWQKSHNMFDNDSQLEAKEKRHKNKGEERGKKKEVTWRKTSYLAIYKVPTVIQCTYLPSPNATVAASGIGTSASKTQAICLTNWAIVVGAAKQRQC